MIVSLCSGYGGLDRAVAAAFRLPIAAHAEPEKIRTRKAGPLVDNPVLKVLEARFPGVPNLGDITAVDWSPWRGSCSILCAGFPCQPVSAAGRQLADNDERWLWPAVHRAILSLAPEWIVLENVANIVSIQGGFIWRKILDDLRMSGYDVAWGIFGACLIGACHHRHRMFLTARRGTGREAIRWSGEACGVPGASDLLRTPSAQNGDQRGQGSVEHMQRRMESGHTINLGDQLRLLPTSTAQSYGSNRGGAAGRAGPVRHSLDTPGRLDGFGRFTPAVARHADRFGAPPSPTETGPKGGVRMAAPFPEWMMGLAPGYVTDLLPRNDALRAIGNGVMPQQGYYAINVLCQMLDDQIRRGQRERHAAGTEGGESVGGGEGSGGAAGCCSAARASATACVAGMSPRITT